MYSDDDLVRELSEVINRTIDHPVDTRRLADAAFSLRGLDAELATVTFDSALEPELSAGRARPVRMRGTCASSWATS